MSWSNQPFPEAVEPSVLELRRQVDRALARALVDDDFAIALLADPGLAIKSMYGESGPYLDLKAIHASSLRDFARQALEVFASSLDRQPDPELCAARQPSALVAGSNASPLLDRTVRGAGTREFPSFAA